MLARVLHILANRWIIIPLHDDLRRGMRLVMRARRQEKKRQKRANAGKLHDASVASPARFASCMTRATA